MHKELNRSGFYYGFPVLLATTKDQKGRDDITVLSSSWTLGDSVVLGIGVDNKGYKNIQNGSDITLNLSNINPAAPETTEPSKIASLSA